MDNVDLKQAVLFLGGIGMLNVLGAGYLTARRVTPKTTMDLTKNFIKNLKNKV